MITTTVMRRVLARLEDEAKRLEQASLARGKAGAQDDPTRFEEYYADKRRLEAIRQLQANDQLVADLVEQLNAETRA